MCAWGAAPVWQWHRRPWGQRVTTGRWTGGGNFTGIFKQQRKVPPGLTSVGTAKPAPRPAAPNLINRAGGCGATIQLSQRGTCTEHEDPSGPLPLVPKLAVPSSGTVAAAMRGACVCRAGGHSARQPNPVLGDGKGRGCGKMGTLCGAKAAAHHRSGRAGAISNQPLTRNRWRKAAAGGRSVRCWEAPRCCGTGGWCSVDRLADQTHAPMGAL